MVHKRGCFCGAVEWSFGIGCPLEPKSIPEGRVIANLLKVPLSPSFWKADISAKAAFTDVDSKLHTWRLLDISLIRIGADTPDVISCCAARRGCQAHCGRPRNQINQSP